MLIMLPFSFAILQEPDIVVVAMKIRDKNTFHSSIYFLFCFLLCLLNTYIEQDKWFLA